MSPLYEGYLVDLYIDSKGDTETVVTMSASGPSQAGSPQPGFLPSQGQLGASGDVSGSHNLSVCVCCVDIL